MASRRKAASAAMHPQEWYVTLECGHVIGKGHQKPLNTDQKNTILAHGYECRECDKISSGSSSAPRNRP